MNPVVIIGMRGRMSVALQHLFQETKIPYKVFSDHAPSSLRVSDLKNSSGVIDFSTPQMSESLVPLVDAAKAVYVCGTTGWASDEVRQSFCSRLGKVAPAVFDSNFSIGIEILCQLGELLAKNSPSTRFHLEDIHHEHKKDAPSGTSLKIRDRVLGSRPDVEFDIHSLRMGEAPGEHSIQVGFGDEWIEVSHRAFSRKIFAQGAVRALKWAQGKPAGLYQMKDVLA